MAKDEKRIDGFLGILTSTEEPEETQETETQADDADADDAAAGQAETPAREKKKSRSTKSKKSGSKPARERASRSPERTQPAASEKGTGTARAPASEPVAEQPEPEERAGEEPRASGPVRAAGASAVPPPAELTDQLLHIPQREQLPLRIPKNHRFPAGLYEKIEAVVYWERLPSNTQFIVNACQAAIDALEAERGKPYPPKPS